MPAFELFRNDISLLRTFSGSDSRLVTAAGLLDIYYKGARISGGTGGGPGVVVVPVYDVGTIAQTGGDVVKVDGAGNSGTVTTTTLTTVTVNWAGAVTWGVGSRLIVISRPGGINNRPIAYSDPQGTVSLGSQIATDPTSGSASFYTKAKDIDIIGTVSGVSRVLQDQAGQGEAHFIDPLDFGMFADGVTDDSPALARAFAYAQLKGGGVVLLPPGTIQLASVIDMGLSSNITLRGSGRNFTILQFVGAALSPLISSGQDGVVENMTIQRTVTANAGTIILNPVGLGTGRNVYRNLMLKSGGTGILSDTTNDSLYDDILFSGTGWERFVLVAVGSNRAQFRTLRGRFDNDIGTSTAAIHILDGVIGARFDHCDVGPTNPAANTGQAVLIEGGTTTRDVVFTACRFSGGNAGGKERAAVVVTAGRSIKFMGCTVESSLEGYNVSGANTADVQILGGTSFAMRQNSVHLVGGSHTEITGLASSNVSQAGGSTFDHVLIDGTVSDVRIIGLDVGNFIAPTGGPPLGLSGVRIASGAGTRIFVYGVTGNEADLGASFVTDLKLNTQLGVHIAHSQFAAGQSSPHEGFGFASRAFSAGETTPNAQDVGVVTLNYGAGIVITNFLNGQVGQILFVTNVGANSVQINNGANLITNIGGGNVTLNVDKSVAYCRSSKATQGWTQFMAQN